MSSPRPRLRRRILSLWFTLAAAAVTPAVASEPPPVPWTWHADLAAARADAKAQGRLIWVQFTGSWCPNCVRMERETFPDAAFSALASVHFSAVRLPAEENEAMAVGYGFNGLPATLILRPDGAVVARVQGFMDPATAAAFLRRAVADATQPGRPAQSARVEPELALAGFCPVSLVERHKLTPGRPDHSADVEGHRYRFASATDRARFLNQPAHYTPVNRGGCPVARVDRGEFRPGSPRFGTLYEGHLYLFGSDEERGLFVRNPSRYTRIDLADRGFCPHCRAVDGRLVRSPDGRAAGAGVARPWSAAATLARSNAATLVR